MKNFNVVQEEAVLVQQKYTDKQRDWLYQHWWTLGCSCNLL